MAKRSIGELVTVLSVSSERFDQGLANAEKRLTAFAKTAASPLKFGMGAVSGVGGILGSVGAFTRPLSDFMSKLPGPDDWAHLLDPERATRAFNELQGSLVELGRESSRLGISPQFLKSLRAMAGEDAPAAESALNKLFLTIGSGTPEAIGKLERWGLSWEELRKSTPEELLGAIADKYKSLDDPLDRAAMRFDLAGKGAAALHKVLKGGKDAIEEYVETIQKLGIATPRQVVMAEMARDIQKGERLEYEGFTANAFERYGAARVLGKEVMESAPSIFSKEWSEGWSAYVSSFIDSVFGGQTPIPPSRQAEFEARLAEKTKPALTADQIEGRRAFAEAEAEAGRIADQMREATDAIFDVNDALTEQDRMLRLTEQGWAGFEKQVMQLQDAVAAGGDVFAAMEVMDRIAEAAAGKQAKEQEKLIADQEQRIRQRLTGMGTVDRFAPTALAGSQEAYAAYNRDFAAPSQVGIDADVRQIVEMMKGPTQLSPEMEERIREAARELVKLNNKLEPLGPA